MIDIQKQVVYWRDSAIEDWQVSNELMQSGRFRHALFFAQLAIEKSLKGHVCLHTQDLAPRIHNLVRLAEITGLDLSQQQIDILAQMNSFNIEGRYPDSIMLQPSREEAFTYLAQAKDIFQWLTSRLS
jgi:HEPN domain-containing protein